MKPPVPDVMGEVSRVDFLTPLIFWPLFFTLVVAIQHLLRLIEGGS